jgi:BolA family transcriptional regulator, general stress-responsive regulator
VNQKTLQQIIDEKLKRALSPDTLTILDESHKHIGHEGAKPGESTHFRIKVVSKKFTGMSQLQRHRLVYDILADELKTKIHALSLTTLDQE